MITNLVKLAEATAWPFASIVIALVVLAVTWMIVTRDGKFGFKFKDWINVEADTSKQLADAVAAPVHVGPIDEPDAATAGGDLVTTSDGSAAAPMPTIANTTEENTNSPFSRLMSATTLRELDAAFDDFRHEADVQSDLDFWNSFIIDRKKELGVAGTSDELEALAAANPTWVYPTLDLLRLAIETRDTDRALKLINQLLARRNTSNSTIVLATILHAYFILYSPERAMQFYRDQVISGVTSSERASMLTAFAGNVDKAVDKFAYRAASEMAVIADPGTKAEGFQLAYSYAEDAKSWALAYNAYSEIGTKSSHYIWSINNRGVLLQGIDKAAAIDYYENGMNVGNAQSISNLARYLIDDGYIASGERLLDAIKEPGDAAEHIATTRAAALSARRELQKRLVDISNFADAEARRYRTLISKVLRAQENGLSISNGYFGSEDGSVVALIDAVGAAVRNVVGSISFEGVLPTSSFGFDGTLYQKGSMVLGSFTPISIFATGVNDLTAVIWPTQKTLTNRIRYVELTRRTNTSALAEDRPAAVLIEN